MKIFLMRNFYNNYFLFFFLFVVDFVIHWNETAMGLNACKTIIFLKNILFECVLNQFKDQGIQIIQFKKNILPEKTFCSHWCRILSQYTYVIAMSFTILYLLCSKLGSLKKHVNVKSLHRVGLPHGLAHQAPLSMGFSRQEYWSRLPSPSPGDLPDPGIEPRSSSLQADALALPSELPGKL